MALYHQRPPFLGISYPFHHHLFLWSVLIWKGTINGKKWRVAWIWFTWNEQRGGEGR